MKKQKISVGDWVKFDDLYGQHSVGYVFGITETRAEILYYDADGDLASWNMHLDWLTKSRKMKHLHYVKIGIHNAFINTKQKILHVGCQKIPFTQVQQIAKTIRQLSKV